MSADARTARSEGNAREHESGTLKNMTFLDLYSVDAVNGCWLIVELMGA
jgi:hypothetical protein